MPSILLYLNEPRKHFKTAQKKKPYKNSSIFIENSFFPKIDISQHIEGEQFGKTCYKLRTRKKGLKNKHQTTKKKNSNDFYICKKKTRLDRGWGENQQFQQISN